MYKVKVNDAVDFTLDQVQGVFRKDSKDLAIDISEFRNGHYHVLYKNKSYTVEVVSTGDQHKTALIKVNGKVYETGIEDRFDLLIKEMGLEGAVLQQAADVKAPMPGLVLKINVVVGQEVKKGDSLLVLEAMKMENMLKSTAEGIVKTIHVHTGDKVEKNQVLITF